MRRICAILLLWLIALPIYAEDYTSQNFIVRDPVITIAGQQASSQDFQYYSSVGQLAPGESTSSNFTYHAGFLYFPTANTPVLSATAGDGKVDLSWTTSTGALANVTHYELGTATVSGGPYTFEDVGNVLSFSKNNLTNGTRYYFTIKAEANTLVLAQSLEVSATPVANNNNGGPGGGPGGGGGPGPGPITQVNFSGRAYPLSRVTILQDGQITVTTIAGPDANFSVSINNLSGGNYTFSVYGEDAKSRRSSLFNFPIFITQGVTTSIGGIFISPTIDVDKSEVAQGDNIAIFGQSVPNGDITIAVNSNQQFFNNIKSDKNGVYLYNFDTSPLEMGNHSTKSKAAVSGLITSFSDSVGFLVGDKNVAKSTTCGKGDLNCDGRVNLVDFSIAAFWYQKPLSTSFKKNEKDHLNGDGKIDLIDFSILAYYWTG